jgi:hypothetical protein
VTDCSQVWSRANAFISLRNQLWGRQQRRWTVGIGERVRRKYSKNIKRRKAEKRRTERRAEERRVHRREEGGGKITEGRGGSSVFSIPSLFLLSVIRSSSISYTLQSPISSSIFLSPPYFPLLPSFILFFYLLHTPFFFSLNPP